MAASALLLAPAPHRSAAASRTIASQLAMAVDPVRMARRAGIVPDPWQAGLLRDRASKEILLLCSRQAGKSTASALLAVDESLHHAPALVLILAPALRQSQELFRKIKAILTDLGDAACPVERETELTLEFGNGSRVVCLPGKEATVRGFSRVSLLIVDEASRVRDDLYGAMRPTLAVSGGRVLLLSTPWGRRGFFFEEYENGGPRWKRIVIRATDCPRIPPSFIETERESRGDWWVRQEYFCEFVETEDQVFGYQDVMDALDDDIEPLFEISEPPLTLEPQRDGGVVGADAPLPAFLLG